jgi:hypothetical protein
MRRFRSWVVVMLVVLQSLVSVVPVMAQGASRAVDQAGDARDRMLLTVTAEAIGQNIAHLALSATPLLGAPAVQVHWDVGAAQLIDGPADETLGAVAAEGTAQQARTVVFPGAGLYPLGVLVTYEPYTGAQYGASGMLFALVDAGGGVTLSDRDPNAVSSMHSTLEAQVTLVDPQVQIAGVTQAQGCFNVSGTITRIDRMNTQSGRAAATMVPVRNALVEMREEDVLFDDSYGEVVTDASGNYSFSFCDDDGVFDDELEIYVRLRAELFSGSFAVVEVEDSSYIDETYEYDSNTIDSEGGTFDLDFQLTEGQSEVFNIADAALDAFNFWNASGGATGDDARFDYEAEIHWEPGYGDSGSYYNGYVFDEITIADDPSDPDQWDDSVIMHEWGHQADDNYGCDDNPGGKHSFGQSIDPELAWGEGYPDYYQSAVRSALGVTDGNFYIDANGMGNNRITLNLESIPGSATAGVEDAIAAMLWDLADNANDGQDRTGVGHAVLQEVYTHPEFESNGDIFDDTCTAFVYLLAWSELGKPTDGATAASVTQNVGLPNPFAKQALIAAASDAANHSGTNSAPNMEIDAATVAEATAADNTPVQAAAVQQVAATNVVPGGTPEDYIWWQKVTMVADNSPSMAGVKFDAAKTVMQEQVNDLDDLPAGVEFGIYTFNNSQPGSQEVVRGLFYADTILPAIQGLTTSSGGVEPCQVNAFSALAASIQDKKNGEAWVYTDGETTLGPGVEAMQQMLTTRGLHGSFVMMGGCSSPPDAQPNTSGAAYNFLGKAANGTQSSGIVPYLLTAIASGGNFLFVNQSQLSDAADILRAQLSHSAGAGRWSDYVSDTDTYTWDKLTSWEWINTASYGDYKGQSIGNNNPVEIAIAPVTVYGSSFNSLGVYGNGYIRMGAPPSPFQIATRYLNILNADLDWEYIISVAAADSPDAPNAGYVQGIYATDTGEWIVITTDGRRSFNEPRTYQALLNKNTGEIRYQYRAVPSGDSGNAIIGVEEFSSFVLGSNEVVVSNKDAAGALPNMGYKFTPMPPQPTKTFTVPVDVQMGGVGFLLTGYSGSFDPMVVRDPNGTPVDCNAAGVLCLNLGLVQYVQSNVDGRNGEWKAEVSAGATGQGTFSFSAMGASAIKVASPFDHQLPVGRASQLLVDLGAPAAGNQLTAWFRRPDGSAFGAPFTLLDDGGHGDDVAGDGKFGLLDYTPPGGGVAYLWVRGTVNGTDLQRSDPAPYNFQPLLVEGTAEAPYLGTGTVDINYTITNLGDIRYCYNLPVQAPTGWTAQWQLGLSEVINGFCLDAGQSEVRTLRVTPLTLQDPAPSGLSGEIIVTIREKERGQIVDSAATTLTRYNPPALVAIENHATSSYLRPNGTDAILLTVGVFDSQNHPVVDGTLVDLSTTLGTVDPAQGATVNGQVPVNFTAGTTPGDAVVTAMVGALVTTTVVPIQNALPDAIVLDVAPADLRNAPSASLVATVRDQWDNPVAGQIVRIGAENDGESGDVAATGEATTAEIQANEVVTLTTDAQGQVSATFTKAAGATGSVGVRAELLFDDGDGTGLHLAAEDRRTILLSDINLFIFLPTIRAD